MTAASEFAGRVVVVTGAGRGQGRAIAQHLAGLGARVAICDVATPKLETVNYPLSRPDDLWAVARTIEAEGGVVLARTCDIRVQSQIDAFIADVLSLFGRIDVLVNNAGILSGNKPAHALSDDEFLTVLDVNLVGQWRMMRGVIPHMIANGSGRIINIASGAGLVGVANFAHYCASKHGLVGLTKAMAAELAQYRITVNAVCPGFVKTGMTDHTLESMVNDLGMSRESAQDVFFGVQQIKQFITPEQIAASVAYLASDAASVVTGTSLSVDCGWTAA